MKHTNILMVCLGNICRSPLAEGLLRSKLPFTRFHVDSAGTYGGHAGSEPDKRSIAVAQKNGVDISYQRSRKFELSDFEKFDHIYVMDDSNYRDLLELATKKRHKSKIKKILDEVFPGEDLDVPDPYNGALQGFDQVYNMLDKATDVIADNLHRKHKRSR